MKRLHIHLKTRDLDQSVRFYTALFGCEPDRREADYAKWLLDEPAANVSLSSRRDGAGVDHVGVQFETDEALDEIAARMKAEGAALAPQADAACCYAKSNKYWAQSPEGAVWELFHTFGDNATYGDDAVPAPQTETPQAASAARPTA